MARTDITVTDAPGKYASSGTSITFEAADTTNQNSVKLTGREMIIARNTDGASAHNVTINSSSDPFNRTGDITNDSIPADGIKVYGPFPNLGWIQSDGKLHFEADSTSIEFAVIRLP